MRRRLLLVIPAVVVLAAGIAIAFYATRKPPSGELETAVTDVTVVAPTVPETPRPTPKPPKPEPTPRDIDKRCWPMFGGGPTRDLARLDIDLGIPHGKRWARGLKSYVEYPPSYCDGVLYVNTFKGDTWAIEAETGKVLFVLREHTRPVVSVDFSSDGKLLVTASEDQTARIWNTESGERLKVLAAHAKELTGAVFSPDGTLVLTTANERNLPALSIQFW